MENNGGTFWEKSINQVLLSSEIETLCDWQFLYPFFLFLSNLIFICRCQIVEVLGNISVKRKEKDN